MLTTDAIDFGNLIKGRITISLGLVSLEFLVLADLNFFDGRYHKCENIPTL